MLKICFKVKAFSAFLSALDRMSFLQPFQSYLLSYYNICCFVYFQSAVNEIKTLLNENQFLTLNKLIHQLVRATNHCAENLWTTVTCF